MEKTGDHLIFGPSVCETRQFLRISAYDIGNA